MRSVLVDGMTVLCDSEIEVWRAETFYDKEPGTIAWLDELRPTDVFCDVGANIGLYTLYAAKRCAKVYAFEPHVLNAAQLMRNVQANNLVDKVRVLTCALHDVMGGFVSYLPFNYTSLKAGSSGSQLNHTQGENGKAFVPVVVELKPAAALSGLIDHKVIESPDVVKIDVDGNEALILRGLLVGDATRAYPRSVQVELHPESRGKIHTLLVQHEYEHVRDHYTANGQLALNKGVAADTIVKNAIYER